MKHLFKYFLLLLMMLPMAANAQKTVTSAEQQTMVKKIEQTASSIKSMQCTFKQEKSLKLLGDNMVSNGKMYFKQGNKLRWEYTSPYSYIFVINGQKVMMKNGSRKDVIDVKSSKLFQEIARIMMSSITGKCLSDKKDFKVTMTKKDKMWIAKLVPQKKEMKAMFSAINLMIDSEKNMVTQVSLVEKTGDTTNIQLKAIETNGTIDEKLFAVN